jgi:glycosyltransferase involved in cell wall biosynthesis
MNIGLISDLADTGFGRVGRELAKRWIEAGHDMRVIGINFDGREGAVARAMRANGDGDAIRDAFDGVANDPVLSRAVPAAIKGDGMGHNLTALLVDGRLSPGWEPDRMVLVADPVAALHRLVTDEGAMARVPSYNYVPVEGSGLSVFWRTIWEDVMPVAMSRFGQAEIAAVMGRDDVPYVPHGISDAFHRVTPERPGIASDGSLVTTKGQAKAVFGWEGRTVVLRTDRFVPRKAYPEYVEVIRSVVTERPEVTFVIHCSAVDEGGMLSQVLADVPGSWYGPTGWTHSQVLVTRGHDTFRGFDDAKLNLLYNAADVYASTSYSEGFGLTLAEAAACGVPVVAQRFGAIPEAVGLGGLLVEPAGIVPTSHGHHWSAVDVPAFADALLTLIDDTALRADLGAKGEAHVRRFDWDVAALEFIRIMEERPAWRL